MTDIEQVIAELQYMKRDVREDSDKDITLNKAITLLKKQKPKTAIANPEKYGDYLEHCPSCETVLPMSSQYGRARFCHLCGQAVKWE